MVDSIHVVIPTEDCSDYCLGALVVGAHERIDEASAKLTRASQLDLYLEEIVKSVNGEVVH